MEYKTNIWHIFKKFEATQSKGITMISLIITIIVILILVGVSVTLAIGDTGIINRTIDAKKQSEAHQTYEKIDTAVAAAQLKNGGDVEESKLKKALTEYFGENGYELEGDNEEGWTITVSEDDVSYFVNGEGKIDYGTMIKLSLEQNKVSENNVNLLAKITNLSDLQEIINIVLKSSTGAEIASTVDLSKGTLTANVAENGTYTVTAIAKNNNSKTVTKNQQITILADSWQPADKSNKNQDWYAYKDPEGNIAKVNAPKLADGMTAIKYVQGTNTDDETYATLTGGSQWANAMTKDGSMWVWIPRFAYRITSGYHQSGTDINPEDGTKGAGTIEIAFLKGNTNQFLDGSITGTIKTSEITDSDYDESNPSWILAPGFEFGGEHLTGFWFAKFEASNTLGYGTSSPNANDTSLTLQIKPNARSWTYIDSLNMFAVCKELTRDGNYSKYFNSVTNVDTHMTKNVEWGAVAYLAHSEYGLKGEEIYINNYNGFKTGISGTSPTAPSSSDSSNEYNTVIGINASTTKNVYGIYDMSGGATEYVAACYTGYEETKLTANVNSNPDEAYIKKYIDVYNDYNISKYGDAVYETSDSSTSRENAWFKDSSYLVARNEFIMIRGGNYSNEFIVGLFCFNRSYGEEKNTSSFRPVCTVQ